LGWKSQAMPRSAPECQATGRCLQGCPSGGKLSMEASYVPAAQSGGAKLRLEHRADKILFEKDKAIGVSCFVSSKKRVNIRARKGVLVACGVVHSPLLLMNSGIKHPLIGKYFQTHLSIGICGLLDRPVREIAGPPQGIEISAFKGDNIKLATQLLPPELLLSRGPLAGRELVDLLQEKEKLSCWTVSVPSEANGTVSRNFTGHSAIKFNPTQKDLFRVRSGLRALGNLLFEMGATRVFPGVMGRIGIPSDLRNPEANNAIRSIPLDSRNFVMSAAHLFGTCRMGSDTSKSVVDENFNVRGTKNLKVIDASVFPTPIGVNPQHAIMSLAGVAAHRLLET